MRSEGFIPVALASLVVDTILSFDVYYQPDPARGFVLYREKQLDFTKEQVDRLVAAGMTQVFVSERDVGEYWKYVEGHLPALMEDANVGVAQKAEVLYECSKGLMIDVLRQPRAPRVLERSGALVGTTVAFMSRENAAFRHLMSVVSQDYYTYTHSVNVMTFAIAFSIRLGYDTPEFLSVFGEAALLHDLGKSNIDSKIINSPDKLSQEQWQVMQEHPNLGCEILQSLGEKEELVFQIVKHHHEKLNGGGYPDKLSSDQIPRFARIVAIVDVYDALTTRRSYKEALDPPEALKLMSQKMSEELDRKYFPRFVDLILKPEG